MEVFTQFLDSTYLEMLAKKLRCFIYYFFSDRLYRLIISNYEPILFRNFNNLFNLNRYILSY